MAKVRVYELAKELGLESKDLLKKLNDMGEFVRSASSTIEPPVVRRLNENMNAAKSAGAAAAPAKTSAAKPTAPAPRPAPRVPAPTASAPTATAPTATAPTATAPTARLRPRPPRLRPCLRRAPNR